jgi:hypothetical protein
MVALILGVKKTMIESQLSPGTFPAGPKEQVSVAVLPWTAIVGLFPWQAGPGKPPKREHGPMLPVIISTYNYNFTFL